jgi:predicted RNA polymerase sigma factor
MEYASAALELGRFCFAADRDGYNEYLDAIHRFNTTCNFVSVRGCRADLAARTDDFKAASADYRRATAAEKSAHDEFVACGCTAHYDQWMAAEFASYKAANALHQAEWSLFG